MQTTHSNNGSTNTANTLPTAAQVYQSQLEDYELLLSFLRTEVGSLTRFAETLLKPSTYSPLDQQNQMGQLALQALMKDSDYRELCTKKNVSPHYLIVTARDGTWFYETSNRDLHDKTTLELTGSEKWQDLKIRIEKAARLMGGQIRYDRLVSLPRIATFYGVAPWDPTDTNQHQSAINAVEEKIASYRLKLEDDVNIFDLRRPLTEKDRRVFQSVQTVLPADTQELHSRIIRADIIAALKKFLPEKNTSPFTHLANDILSSASTEQVRATPSVYLQKILQSPEAERLVTVLLSAMDWYGGKTGEETAPLFRLKVIANALQIWLKSPITEHPDGIAGYNFKTRLNWGKSYQAIWSEFETHLLVSKRAASEKEAIVIARLFLCQFPAEFRVSDIPTDLPYRSSVVWVNFLNGVNLANAADSAALGNMTFQQLVDLPLERAEGATAEQLNEISLARLLPTLDWAVTQGIIPHKHDEDYTQSETERALSELDTHTATLNDAIIQFDEKPPERLSIAKTIAEKLFGKRFIEQDRKLARKRTERIEPIRWNSVPPLPGKKYDYYSIVDLLASDQIDDHTRWYYTLEDGSRSQFFFSIDSDRTITSTFRFGDGSGIPMVNGTLPHIKMMFDQSFTRYLELQTTAYKTLISSQLASLAFADRQAIEWGELKIYSLRKETVGVEAQNETPDIILPLRVRNGLILQTTYANETRTYELLPKAGVVRRVKNLPPELFGGARKTETWRLGKGSVSVNVLRHKTLPFDWDAHSTASTPKTGATCEAILEQLGDAFTADSNAMPKPDSVPMTLLSNRGVAISNFIATGLLYTDPKKLRAAAYGQTQFDREQARKEAAIEIFKAFIPFWKSIEDLASDDKTRVINGAFGLFSDLLSFAQPIGKFASGSAKLVSNTARLTLRARLPAFRYLTKELLILTAQSLNPIDGIASLLKVLGTKTLKFGVSGMARLKGLVRTGHYDFAHSLPQISDAGSWRPFASGDRLATIKGIEDVPVRNVASSGKADYRLVDPLSSNPYGPSLPTRSSELSLGRSRYNTLEKTNDHVIVELDGNTHAREMLEVDGRTTVFLDDVPYRLDGDSLRRVDLIDDSATFKRVPCRLKRMAGGDVCINIYVNGSPDPDTPPLGTFDETKGYAPWFGESSCTPASRPGQEEQFFARDGVLYQVVDDIPQPYVGDLTQLGFDKKWLVPKKEFTATLQFRKGIYGRIEVSGTYDGADDVHRVGAVIVPSLDETNVYVFSRLNTDKYYLARMPAGQDPTKELTFKRLMKADLAEGTEGAEMLRIYTGSLSANNVAAIHGVEALERAMETMEKIAVRIGTTATPPNNMKWVKVDTSPGEALMFDHSTRMIVTQLANGATTWSRSKVAPEAFRQRTAEIFDTLFLEPTIVLKNPDSALRIDTGMRKLHKLLPYSERSKTPRNIAYAEVTRTDGNREVYVSVSGAQGTTGHLPLFKNNLGADNVKVDETTYFNIDMNTAFPKSSLSVNDQGKLLAVPMTIEDIGEYRLPLKPTSLDSESKLISVIREKYPDPGSIKSVNVATTMPPCESCSVVIKEFGFDGAENALNVLWH